MLRVAVVCLAVLLELSWAGVSLASDKKIVPLCESEAAELHRRIQAQGDLSPNGLETGLTCRVPENGFAGNSCEEFIQSLPSDFARGWVDVPEVWNKGVGASTAEAGPTRSIRVFYYGKIDPLKEPVVFYNGGPSSDSHGSYEIFEKIPEFSNHSFVFIDQRGTGCSTLYPKEHTDQVALRLSHYGTRSIVWDSEAVREKLFGTRKWKAFGQSYGGYIVHRYALLAPDSLQGAFAHGASLMTDTVEWLKLRILSQKRVQEEYFAKFPDDKKRVERLRAELTAERCFSDDQSRICGNAVVDSATILLGFQTHWDSLHQWFGSMVNESGNVQDGAVESFVRYFVFGVYLTADIFPGSVISKLEMMPGFSDPQGCALVQERLLQQGEKPETWLINECRLLSGYQTNSMQYIDRMKRTDPFSISEFSAVLDRIQNPFWMFLYSGLKDVFVPVETFEEEVRAVGRKLAYRKFPNSGHEGFHTEPQIWKDLAR